MKKLLLCAATFLAMGSVAMAFPVKLTHTQLCQTVTSGGSGTGTGNGNQNSNFDANGGNGIGQMGGKRTPGDLNTDNQNTNFNGTGTSNNSGNQNTNAPGLP
jgi:hypothetical protein